EGEQDSLLSGWNVYQAAEGGGEGGFVERRTAIAMYGLLKTSIVGFAKIMGLVFRQSACCYSEIK
ncbi:hypothetical protein, partial [Neisseria subflava]|uniref:hypothetical protein n=1 Tax=Neisseria subflava TaxID=28449 RepID=UPI00280A73A6